MCSRVYRLYTYTILYRTLCTLVYYCRNFLLVRGTWYFVLVVVRAARAAAGTRTRTRCGCSHRARTHRRGDILEWYTQGSARFVELRRPALVAVGKWAIWWRAVLVEAGRGVWIAGLLRIDRWTEDIHAQERAAAVAGQSRSSGRVPR